MKSKPSMTVDGLTLYAVPGYEGLHVTADGRHVYGLECSTGIYKRRRVYITTRGYAVVRNMPPQKGSVGINVLVARALIGPPPTSRHVVARKNGQQRDNRIENLYYCTKQEAVQNAFQRRNPGAPRRDMTARRPEELRSDPWTLLMNQYADWAKLHREPNLIEGPRPDSREFDDE